MEKPWLKSYEPGVPEEVEVPEIPLYQLFDDVAKDFPDKTCCVFLGNERSYSLVKEQSEKLANALKKIGIKPGDVIGILLGNMPQFIIGFFGALKAGAIITLINPLYQPPEIAFQLNDSGAKAIIVIDIMHDKFAKIREETGVKHTIVTTMADAFPGMQVSFQLPEVSGYYLWSELLENAEPTPPKVKIKPKETPAVLLYTGGTTGTPKGAILTHYNLVANSTQLSSWIPFFERGSDYTFLGVLPFFHSFGLTVCMLATIIFAGKVILHPRPDVEQILRDIPRYNVTFFPGVPTLFSSLLNHEKIDEFDLSSVTACISGAAALPLAVMKGFEEKAKANLIEGYGLTEASPVTHGNPLQEKPPYDKKRPGSIGLPFPSTLAKIVDIETGEELPPGQDGELLIKGPQVMKGYWNKPEETAKQLVDGWLHTGDIARMDEDGFFYIVDRAKQMIDRAGFKIYPRDVEEVLFQHPAVADAAVIGIPDETRGETVMAFVVLKEGQKATIKGLKEFTKDKLAYYKRPEYIEFRDELPKSMVGKTLRRVLQEEQEAKKKKAK